MKNLHFILFGALILLGTLSFTHVTGYQIGDTAEDFELMNVDGNMVSLASYPDAKGYIVIFTCNTCPYAVMYEDRIKALDTKHSAAGYQVIAINPNDEKLRPADDFAAMKVRAQEKAFDFPYLHDKASEVFPKFGARKTPHVFVLDKQRVVKYIGAIDDNAQEADAVTVNYVDAAVEKLNAGMNPDPATTKAIGCSIKSDLIKKNRKPSGMR